MKPLNDTNFATEIAEGRHTVLFWAKWAGPCKAARENLDAASRINDAGAEFATFDLDDNPNVPHMYGIRGVPCFMTFEDGKPLAAVVGNVPMEDIMDIANAV